MPDASVIEFGWRDDFYRFHTAADIETELNDSTS
jgi:hypothetical protein